MLISIILIIVVFILIFTLVMCYENKALMVSNYQITSDRVPEGADGVRFVVIADLHSNQFGTDNQELIRKIDQIQPAFIIIAGDLFIAREYKFDIAYELLNELSKRYMIYYSYGNHEQKIESYEKNLQEDNWQVKRRGKEDTRDIKTFDEFMERCRKLGVNVLNNKAACIDAGDEEKICIYGGTIDLDYFKRIKRPPMTCDYLNTCFGESHKEYEILIAHNPMYFDTYAAWGADLVLSGHVHGGMVRIPFIGGVISPQMEIFPKYDGGLYTKDINGRQSNMIVSRGLGIHTFKIRLFNRPELVSVTLKRK